MSALVVNFICPNCNHSESLGSDVITAPALKGSPFLTVVIPAPKHGAKSSPRELDVIRCVAEGMNNRDIGMRLCISEQTVKNHLHNIFEKLGVNDRLQLALYALHFGLVAWSEAKQAEMAVEPVYASMASAARTGRLPRFEVTPIRSAGAGANTSGLDG